ncbi:hypothetical protein H0H81_006441 [Sphagnurus paluster]|uniref:Uncharacterized protein n=1 Tax=Sphagnurus paluster TaxID=117069 RepID=A0A9P7FTQ9_9AGAR|nr:hypothetical protein H0H81_006441 [Sphagnurus paluster]
MAMQAKYGTLHFNNRDQYTKNLHQNAISTQYVRSIHVSLHEIANIHVREYNTGILAKITGRGRTHYAAKTKKCFDAMLELLRNLPNVRLLEFKLWHSYGLVNVERFVPIVKTSWAASGSILQVLKLGIPIEGLQLVLSPSIIFPCLEELYLEVSRASLTSDPALVMTDVLALFLNNHYTTLRLFHLDSRHQYKFNTAPLLLNLQKLPHLEDFAQTYDFVSIRQTDTSGLTYVLRLHSDQLRSLFLLPNGQDLYGTVPTPDEWYAQDFLSVPLPQLERLTLSLINFSDMRRTTGYLSRFSATLTSLTLLHRGCTYSEVDVLTEAFYHQRKLRRLAIVVEVMSPPLLVLLATKLSALRVLDISYERINSAHSGNAKFDPVVLLRGMYTRGNYYAPFVRNSMVRISEGISGTMKRPGELCFWEWKLCV